MSFADQLAATPLQIRCFALVGQFLSHWAALEATINNAIQTAYQITSEQAAVLTQNMQLRDKINVLRTVCHLCVGAGLRPLQEPIGRDFRVCGASQYAGPYLLSSR
jgi:hypothetical protein